MLGIETDFAEGAFRLARALGRPLLPVVLTGGHRVRDYPYSARVRYGQRVSVKVLPPVPVEEVRACAPGHLRQLVQRRLKAAALTDEVAPPRRFVPERDDYWDGFAYRIDPTSAELHAAVTLR